MLLLKQLRSIAKETQQEVAAAVGVDRTTYAKYESGASEPSIEMLQRLAKHFDVSLSQLLGETNEGTGAPLTLDDFTFAMHNHSGQLTERDKQILLSLAQQLSEAHQQEEEGGKADGD